MFAADRFSGEPAAGCDVRVLARPEDRSADGRPTPMGCSRPRCRTQQLDDVVGVAQCGDQVAATDPGSWSLQQPARELAGYIYTDKPIYRPGTHRSRQGGAALARSGTRSLPFDRPDAEVVVADANDKVIFRRAAEGGRVRRRARRRSRCRPRPRSATTRIARPERRRAGGGRLRGAGVSQARIRSASSRRRHVSSCRAAKRSSTVQARYYFGQPVANGQRALRRQPAAVLLAAAMERRCRRRRRRLLVRRRPDRRGRRCGSTPAAAHEIRDAARASTRTAATTARASKRRSPMPRTARSRATRSSTPRTARSCSRRRSSGYVSRGRQPRRGVGPRASTTPAPRSRAYRVAFALERARIPRRLLQRADGDASGHGERRPPMPTAARLAGFTLPNRRRQLPRARHRAERRAHRRGRHLPLGAGPERSGRQAAIAISSCSPTEELPARRHRAADRARRDGRPARCWSPRKASTCRGTGCCGRRRPTHRSADRAGDVGDVYVSLALSARRPAVPRRTRLGVPAAVAHVEIAVTRRAGRVEAAGPGDFNVCGHRSRRRAGAGAGQPRR